MWREYRPFSEILLSSGTAVQGAPAQVKVGGLLVPAIAWPSRVRGVGVSGLRRSRLWPIGRSCR